MNTDAKEHDIQGERIDRQCVTGCCSAAVRIFSENGWTGQWSVVGRWNVESPKRENVPKTRFKIPKSAQKNKLFDKIVDMSRNGVESDM